MTTYRTGNHHGITIIEQGGRCLDPDHDCERGHLAAVVVDGGQELAERICALLNRAEVGNPRGYHPTCVETTAYAEMAAGTRSFVCGPNCPPPPPTDVCTCGHDGLHEMFHLRPCPIAEARIARRGKPAPPPVGPGCVCEAGMGRTCPRHGAVI